MKQKTNLAQLSRTVLWLGLIVCVGLTAARAQTPAFTYQGRFTDSTVAQPTSGTYNMQFGLHSAEMGAALIQTLPAVDVVVANGVFTVNLNFTAANAFDGNARFLEIAVRRIVDPQNPPPFAILTPRQPLTSSPYAIRTLSAGVSDGLSNLCVGCVTNANINSIDGAKVTGTVANAVMAGNVTGVVPIASGGTGSTEKNFVDLSTNQANIAGNKTFTGTISGNGAGLTNLNGANIAPNSIPPSAIASGSITLNPQRLALLRFYDVNTTFQQIDLSSTCDGLRALVYDGTFVYAACQTNSNGVMRIRANTGVVESSVPNSGGTTTRGLAFDGTFVYVTRVIANTVTRIRAATGVVEGSPIPLGSFPEGIVFDGTFVWVGIRANDNVVRIRAATGVVEGSPIPVGDQPSALAFDGTFIYAANALSDSVTRIRAATGIVEGSPIPVGDQPNFFAFDGTFIYVSNTGSDSVTRIRAATGVVEGSPISVGDGPHGLAFDGTFVWVANSNSGSVTRIRAATGVVEGSPLVLGFPVRALVFDGVNIYGGGGGWVTRF